MNVLGFDTSTSATSACVLREDGEAFEVIPPFEALAAPPAHARELMPGIAQVLEQAGLAYGDLHALAVGVGPGTFTGLRIGIASARALATATGLPLRPVSSLAALAQGIDSRLRLALIDARRGELFAALYEGERELWPPFASGPEDLVERLQAGTLTPRCAGDGAVRFMSILEAAGLPVEPSGSQAHVVRAIHVCRLAAQVEPVAPEAVLPDYIRAPDAIPR